MSGVVEFRIPIETLDLSEIEERHVENEADRKILAEASSVLADYRRRRERYIGDGKPGVIELLRDWCDDGTGRCDPSYSDRLR
jgi:hypothetical protein